MHIRTKNILLVIAYVITSANFANNIRTNKFSKVFPVLNFSQNIDFNGKNVMCYVANFIL